MVLSFWNYLPLEFYKENVIDDWNDIGSNVAMSFVYDSNVDSKDKMIEFLDLCLKRNIKVLIVDKRTLFYELDKINEDEYRKNVKNAYRDFGKHKATYGFFIGDEPNFEHIDKAIRAVQIFKEECGELIPFLNLLPYFYNLKSQRKYGRNLAFFENIVEKIFKETNIPVIGFDHYTQCFDDLEDQEKGIKYFIEDLEGYARICKKHNVKLFVSLLSVGHWNYRVPNFNDLRWQMNVSLAYGAKGIFWFYFHQKSLDESYRKSPFYGETFIKTETYNSMKIIQNDFRNSFEKEFDEMEFVKVEKLNTNKEFTIDNLIVKSHRKLLYFVSTFIKNSKTIYMLTNGSQKYSNKFIYKFNDSEKEIWLAPGEFKLLAYEK